MNKPFISPKRPCIKVHCILTLLCIFFTTNIIAQGQITPEVDAMKATWQKFRNVHPFGYQTVAIHQEDYSHYIIIISEPPENIQVQDFQNLANEFNGSFEVMRQPFGYDGWLSDVVMRVQLSENEKTRFTSQLFNMLYYTDYKAYYTDLDANQPLNHTFYSHDRLNFSITAEEIQSWFIDNKELFYDDINDRHVNITQLLSSFKEQEHLYFSKEKGFVIWVMNTNFIVNPSNLFKETARKFTLDTDIIIGAIGTIDGNVAIIARERMIPVDVLPPLRVETISMLAHTSNAALAQSYERYHVFGGKTNKNQDVAPIYLSDELWHTEYGNLLNVTDQMLKSWCENGEIEYDKFPYPTPCDWAFNRGALLDIGGTELTYNWNTSGAGYVVQNDNGIHVYAVNRTGSLPVSFIPEGMEGKSSDDVLESEELAYDFFSGLNNTDLARVVQYATLYQIFQYYVSTDRRILDESLYKKAISSSNGLGLSPDIVLYNTDNKKVTSIEQATTDLFKPHVPDYSKPQSIIEGLLRLAADTTTTDFKSIVSLAKDRYYKVNLERNNIAQHLNDLIDNDPYSGTFADFISSFENDPDYVYNALHHVPTREESDEEFEQYLRPNLDSVSAFINNYRKAYGDFPYALAAKYCMSRYDIEEEWKRLTEEDADYEALLNKQSLALEKRRIELNKRIDEHNKSNSIIGDPSLELDISQYKTDEKELERRIDLYYKKYAKAESEFLKNNALAKVAHLSRAIGALNWLLTDPAPYDEPVGEFFAHFNTSHSAWMKSPSIVSSNNSFGYGGHNLNARALPIKVSPNIRPGQCKVVVEGGKRSILVSAADKGRITTANIREIERKGISGNFKLSERAPVVKTPKTVLGTVERPVPSHIEVRGFEPQKMANVGTKSAFLEGKQMQIDDLFSEASKRVVSSNPSSTPIKEIRLEHYSEVEVKASIDDLREVILDRSDQLQISLENFDINGITAVKHPTEPDVWLIRIPEKNRVFPNADYKEAALEFCVPEQSTKIVQDGIQSLFDLPTSKTNNRFKILRELRRSLEKHPEISPDDIRDDIMLKFVYIPGYEISIILAA